jgi:TPP-dependent pyruvate/acetoin dehydrogenase alpha subunit
VELSTGKVSCVNKGISKKELIEFERHIAELYEQAKIKAPIHLAKGNENKLIKIFKDYRDSDWVFTTYRSHYHWLLSGRNPEELKKQIVEGHSMHIFGSRFFTSAIVGGHVPIALGVALALKIKNSSNKVWCFMGDMAGESGIVHESIKYARGHGLPITFVIEDNDYSVRALTKETWGRSKAKVAGRYKYKRHYPHAGTGKYVMF